jgi:hypothetical protein
MARERRALIGSTSGQRANLIHLVMRPFISELPFLLFGGRVLCWSGLFKGGAVIAQVPFGDSGLVGLGRVGIGWRLLGGRRRNIVEGLCECREAQRDKQRGN